MNDKKIIILNTDKEKSLNAKKMLEPYNYNIVILQTLDNLIELLKIEQFWLVFLDINFFETPLDLENFLKKYNSNYVLVNIFKNVKHMGSILNDYSLGHLHHLENESEVVHLINKSSTQLDAEKIADTYYKKIYESLDALGIGIILIDSSDNIILATPLASDLLGYDKEFLEKKLIKDIFKVKNIDNEKSGFFSYNMFKRYQDGFLSFDNLAVKTSNGDFMPIRGSVVLCNDEKNNHTYVIGFRKNLDNEKINEELFEKTHTDPLTGLINRNYFQDAMKKLLITLPKENNYYFVLIDIDSFKEINSFYGYEQADKFLVFISEQLQTFFHKKFFTARISSDEFVFILEGKYSEVNEKLIKFKKFIMNYDGIIDEYSSPIKFTVSISYTFLDQNNDDVESLLKKVSDTNTIIKANNGNGVLFYDEDHEYFKKIKKEELDLKNLYNSISSKNYSLTFLSTNNFHNNITYTEVYIEINKKKISKFTDLNLEKNPSLLLKLDKIVISTIFKNKAKFEKQIIGINLFPHSVINSKLLDYILEQQNIYNIDPTEICFELDESNLSLYTKEILLFIEILRNKGFHIAIDNFGKTIGSLSLLNTFIKIDFIKIHPNITNNEYIPIEYISMIKNICEKNNIKTIITRIDDKNLYNKVKNIDFDYYQGFLLNNENSINI